MRSTRQQRRAANGDIARGCLFFGIGGLVAAAVQLAMLAGAVYVVVWVLQTTDVI